MPPAFIEDARPDRLEDRAEFIEDPMEPIPAL
jgi:hypothetical protein